MSLCIYIYVYTSLPYLVIEPYNAVNAPLRAPLRPSSQTWYQVMKAQGRSPAAFGGAAPDVAGAVVVVGVPVTGESRPIQNTWIVQ